MATVTSKGQITIPKRIRVRLGVKPGDRVAFRLGAGGAIVMAVGSVDLLGLAGALKPSRRGITLADMEEAIASGARRRPVRP
jgi:AbrB family looped-hinge helix DNA binding protein